MPSRAVKAQSAQFASVGIGAADGSEGPGGGFIAVIVAPVPIKPNPMGEG